MSITNIQHKVKKSNNEPSGKILSFKCASLVFTAFYFRSMFSVTEKATHGHGEKFQKYKKKHKAKHKNFLHSTFYINFFDCIEYMSSQASIFLSPSSILIIVHIFLITKNSHTVL